MRKWIVIAIDCRNGEVTEPRLIPAKTAREASERINSDFMSVLSVDRFEGERANRYLKRQRELHTRTNVHENCIREGLKYGRRNR